MLSFKLAFSLCSFTLIKKLLSSFSLSAIRVASSAYLRLLIFLSVILITACYSSSLAFCMMYSAYKLNKLGDNIYPRGTPFPILNQSVVPCKVLTVASWLTYTFLWRQVRWSSTQISKNFPQFAVIDTVKGFSKVNEAEVDVFLKFPCFLYGPVNVGNLISGSSAFSKPTLYMRNSWFMYWNLAWKMFSITLVIYILSQCIIISGFQNYSLKTIWRFEKKFILLIHIPNSMNEIWTLDY